LGSHGVLAEERSQLQPFELDIDLTLVDGAGDVDAIDDTVDYGRVAEKAAQIVRQSSHHLLESLAGEVAEALLEEPLLDSVTVAVRKLRPPVPLDLASAGVRTTRRRDGQRT